MVTNHYVEDDFHKVGGIDRNFDRLVPSCESIDNDEKVIIAVAFPIGGKKQPHDKIYGKMLPSMDRNRQRLEVIVELLFNVF